MSIESRNRGETYHSEKIEPRSMEEAFDELKKFGEGKIVAIKEGAVVRTETIDGGKITLRERANGKVIEVKEDSVIIDVNPYAEIHYTVEVPKSKLEVIA